MSDTSGLPNSDAQGVPVEDDPERFERDAHDGGSAAERDAQATEPAEAGPAGAEPGQGAEPPPADFDPARQPSNPDLVENAESPDE